MKRFLIISLSVLALCATQTGLLAQGTQGTSGAEKTKTMNATGTVKSRLHRAMSALRSELEADARGSGLSMESAR